VETSEETEEHKAITAQGEHSEVSIWTGINSRSNEGGKVTKGIANVGI